MGVGQDHSHSIFADAIDPAGEFAILFADIFLRAWLVA
jgi:hypothetical protein